MKLEIYKKIIILFIYYIITSLEHLWRFHCNFQLNTIGLLTTVFLSDHSKLPKLRVLLGFEPDVVKVTVYNFLSFFLKFNTSGSTKILTNGASDLIDTLYIPSAPTLVSIRVCLISSTPCPPLKTTAKEG